MKKTRKLLISILLIALCVSLSVGLVASADAPRTMTKITAVDSASFINFNNPITLAPGEGINMEFYVDEVSGTEDEGMFTNFGFAVSDNAAAGDHYHYGSKGSYFYAQKRELGVYLGKSGVDFNSYEGVGAQHAPVTSTGSWNWSTLLASGNWVRVEYKSASSESAQDGYWKLYSRIGDEGDYEKLFTVENLAESDVPYGNVYFGICTQFAFSMTVADLSITTTQSNTEINISAYSAARGSVETYIEGDEGGDEGGEGDVVVDPSDIPVVDGVSKISFIGIAGKNEAVNRYANITANQGQVVTMTMEVQDVDNSFMSYPNFGFAVSDTAAVGQMYAAGNAGSWIYGGTGDTTVRLYSKKNGAVASGDTPMGMNFTGAFPHNTAVVAGKTLKIEYKPATSGTQDGYWKIYSKDTASENDFELIASVSGLSTTDAPSGSVYFGIHTYRTYKITAKIKLVAGGTSYTLNGGDLAEVEETFKIGDKEIISKTDVQYGEIGNANGQSAIANKKAVVLPAGGTITMEGVILSADISNVPTWNNMGFSIGNAYSTSYLFSASKGSFFFGHTDRALLIYSDKEYGMYSSFVTDRPDYATTGLTVSGNMMPSNWIVPGYTIKVVYKAASSTTARDGSWTLSYRKVGEANYNVMAQVTGMNINSAPYGSVYFGMELTAVTQISFGEFKCYTQDNENVKLEQITGVNKIETYSALNGVVEAPLRNFEKKIFNGSFEIIDENQVPYGWANTATGTILSDNTQKTEGALSAKISGAVDLLSEKIDVKSSKYHHLVIDANTSGALTLGVNYYTIDGTYVSNQEFSLSGNGEWKEYLNQIFVPETAKQAKIYIKTADGFSGNVDGVHLYQVDSEYITDRAQNSADADELYSWLDNGIISFGKVNDQNKDKYFAEVQNAINANGGLTADVLSDCVFIANTPAVDFTDKLLENGNFKEIDKIGIPVDWVWMTDGYKNGSLFYDTTDGGLEMIAGSKIRSRDVKLDEDRNYVFNIKVLSNSDIIFKMINLDESFNVTSSHNVPLTVKEGDNTLGAIFDASAQYIRFEVEAVTNLTLQEVNIVDTTEQKFETYYELISFMVIKGENARQSEIKSNLNLVTEFNEANITWTSSNPSVVSNNGIVNRPAYGGSPVMVTLTATISVDGKTYDKPFNLVVLPINYDELTALTLNNDGFENTNIWTLDYMLGAGITPEGELKNYDYGGYITANNAGRYGFSKAFAWAGEYGIKIAQTSAKSNLRSEQVFDIRENTIYTAAVMAYSESDSMAPQAVLMFFDYKGIVLAEHSVSYNLAQNKTWQNLVVSAPAPIGAVSVAVKMQVPGASVDPAYFDEIRLYREENVDNYDFTFGTNGWTTSGNVTVSENKLSLNSATVKSSYAVANEGAIKTLSTYATVTSGNVTATLTYYNASKGVISTKSQTLTQSGAITISDYAPAGTAYVNATIKATGVANVTPVYIDTTPVGSRIYDNDFALLANGANTSWAVDGAVSANKNNVVISDGASLSSYYVTLQEGKKYTVVADLTESSATNYAVAKLELYNYSKQLADTYNLVLSGTRLSYTFDCPLDGYYVRLVLSSSGGQTAYKSAEFYPIASSVSNAGFEIVDTVVSGTHPIQWSVYGDVGVYAASNEANPETEVFNLLHMLEVVNHNGNKGGVRSAMMEGIISGRSYTASAWVKTTAGKGVIYIDYYDSNFNLLTSYSAESASANWVKVKVSGNAPANTAYATVRLEKQGQDGALYADMAEILPTIVVVDTTQHFIDDYIIEDSENVEREFHQGSLEEIVMGKEENTPWQNEGAYIYGTVLFDEDEQIFKMWYNACSNKGILDAYATSTDGITWVKPTLLKYNFGGNTQNNIIGGNDFSSVIKDYDATDPNKRYVMITFNELQYAHMIKYSADGINWVAGPVFMKSGDVLTGVWNEYYDKYLMLAKRGRTKRDFYTITSSDTTSFTVGVDATTLATPLDAIGYERTDCYGAGLYAMYDSWLAFDWLDKIPGTASSYGKVEIGFGFTRDTEEDWTRPDGANLIIPDTDNQGHTWYSMYSASYAINVKDEIWLYMGNWYAPHEVGSDECAIQIAKWRKDGFASMNFGDTEGSITTKPMIFNGNKLTLNANVLNGGFIKVELIDKFGNVIEGFSENDCEVITSNGTAIEVKWNGSSDLSALVGETVSMKVYGQNAKFYSFTFEGAGSSTVAGEKVALDNTYDYEMAVTADGYIVAPSESTLMSGDNASLEIDVKSTATANTEIAVGIFGQEEGQAIITNVAEIFEEGYTVKLEYVYTEGDSATVNVYRKLTDGGEYGSAVFTETGLKSVIFARLALIANTDITMNVGTVKFAVNGTAMSGFIAKDVEFTELAKELEDLGPQRLTSTGAGAYGYNEGIDLGYGDNITFQFDVLEYINAGMQIRMAVTDANVKAGENAGAYKNGAAGAVIGFTSTGAKDWYGGDITTSKKIDTFFIAGNTYKFVYTAESSAGAGDATTILYECPTSVVGTGSEVWTAVYTQTKLKNTTGGNCFAPKDDVKINIFLGGEGIVMSIDNAVVTSSATVQAYNNFWYSGTIEVTESDVEAPEIKVSTAKTITYTGEAVWGYNEKLNIGYGESVTMQFDVIEASVNARWSFFVTENDVTTAPGGGHNYKAKSTNVLGFATTAAGSAAVIMDWFGGTSYGKSYTAGTFFQAGKSYRLVYTTASSETAKDGMMEIYICDTANVGTASEKWSCEMYQRGFGDTSNPSYDFHPTNDVYFGIWTNGGNITLTLDNIKAFSSEGLDVNETKMTAYGSITVEDYFAE